MARGEDQPWRYKAARAVTLNSNVVCLPRYEDVSVLVVAGRTTGDERRRSYDEHRRGKLVPGYLADLVVLDRDPFELSPEELAGVEVVATMVGGRWTHNPPPWD